MAESKKMGLYEKLMTVQQTLTAPKNQYNAFGKYKYRSCEDILEGLKEPLSKVKAAVTINDEIVLIAESIYVRATATFIDAETGEKVENNAYAKEPVDKKGMDSSQVTGATSSYARKYALNGLFMIDDSKDADTNEAHTEKEERQNKAANAKPTEQDIKKVEKQFIDEKKQKILSDRCQKDNVHPSVIMEKCGVQDFSKLTEKQFAWICGNWSKEFGGKAG